MDDRPTITPVTPKPFTVQRSPSSDVIRQAVKLPEAPYFAEPNLVDELKYAARATMIALQLTPHLVKLIVGIIMKSWKTTLGAIIAGLAGILNALGIVTIPAEVQMGILTTALFIIGLFAQDGKTND
jgi:uncharacterized membrane protein